MQFFIATTKKNSNWLYYVIIQSNISYNNICISFSCSNILLLKIAKLAECQSSYEYIAYSVFGICFSVYSIWRRTDFIYWSPSIKLDFDAAALLKYMCVCVSYTERNMYSRAHITIDICNLKANAILMHSTTKRITYFNNTVIIVVIMLLYQNVLLYDRKVQQENEKWTASNRATNIRNKTTSIDLYPIDLLPAYCFVT